MSKESIKQYVKEARELSKQLNEDCDGSLVRELINNLQCLSKAIEHEHSGWYLAIQDVGPDDNFTRYYRLLGFMTTEKAFKLLEIFPSNGYEDHIKEIDKETWDKYCQVRDLSNFLKSLKSVERCGVIDINIRVKAENKMAALRKELGLRWDWEVVVNKVEY